MSFQSFVQLAQTKFPNLQVKYKDESLLMKIIGTLMFFNKGFMTDFTTTLGETVYFPSQKYVSSHPVSASTVLMHELVHVNDYKKYGAILFTLGYAFPQILVLLALPALLLSWKLSLLFLLFLLPIPAFFRTYFEKRAYLVSLYVAKKLNDKNGYNINLDDNAKFYVDSFKNSTYYYMWPFSVESEFKDALIKIKAGERPYTDDIFDTLDQIISVS